MRRRTLISRRGYDLKSWQKDLKTRQRVTGGVSLLLALLTIVPTVSLLQSNAKATGEQIVMGMPFAGKWAYNVPTTAACGTTAHPSCHPNIPSTGSLSGYHWAVDYYQPDGTNVKINGISAQGAVTFSSSTVSGQSCGEGLVITAKANNVQVGQIYVAHLNDSVVSTNLANEASIGTVFNGGATYNYNGCFGVDHVHFSYKNTAVDHSCYVNYSVSGGNSAGMTVDYATAIGVLGSANAGVQQACTSLPSTSSAWPGVGNAVFRGDTLWNGQTLNRDEYLVSLNVQFALVLGSDGHLVMYKNGAVWTLPQSYNQNAHHLVMQGDGNLVLYRADNSVVWHSGTFGHPGAYLNMQADGNAVVRNMGAAFWASGTGGHPNFTAVAHDLYNGQQINTNEYLRSPDGRYALLMQADGNAVLYGPGAHPLWATGNTGGGNRLVMQADGNLVKYAGAVATWNRGPYGWNSPVTSLQSDGNLVMRLGGIYGTAVWTRENWYSGQI